MAKDVFGESHEVTNRIPPRSFSTISFASKARNSWPSLSIPPVLKCQTHGGETAGNDGGKARQELEPGSAAKKARSTVADTR